MRAVSWWLVGAVMGVAIGAGGALAIGAANALAIADEPAITLRNGPLEGWDVTKDAGGRLCTDPMVFVRAKQIECP